MKQCMHCIRSMLLVVFLVGGILLSISMMATLKIVLTSSHGFRSNILQRQDQLDQETQQQMKRPANDEQVKSTLDQTLSIEKQKELRGLRKSLQELRHRLSPENRSLPEAGQGASQGYPSLTLSELAERLREKLAAAPGTDLVPETITCVTEEDIGNSCGPKHKRCVHQKQLPESIDERIQQLAGNPDLQIQKKHLEVIKNLQRQLDGNYDLIIVTAASSNHYLEVQKMLKSLHDDFYPTHTNFTLVMYDLGLTEQERLMMKKHCRCQVIVFPFEKFPDHVKTLKCFGWKPVVVKAHIEQSSAIAWFDASIRIFNMTNFDTLLERAKTRGVQQRFYPHKEMNPRFTVQEMFHYYGDEACAHAPYIQVETGFGIYHNEALVRQAVIDPWVACGLVKSCGCPRNQARVQFCPRGRAARNLPPYGRCHRSDQSSMSIILAKLFHGAYRYVVVDTTRTHYVHRGRRLDYFGVIERNAANEVYYNESQITVTQKNVRKKEKVFV